MYRAASGLEVNETCLLPSPPTDTFPLKTSSCTNLLILSLVTGLGQCQRQEVTMIKDVRHPSHIRERAIVESSVWHTHRFQLFLCSRLGSEDTLGLVFRYSAELRRAEQLHAYVLGSGSDFGLNIDGLWLNGTDDNVHTGQSLFDGVVTGIVDLNHLGVALDGGFGSLSVHNQFVVLSASCTAIYLVRYFT